MVVTITQVYILSDKEGGRKIPFGIGFNPKIKLEGSPDEHFTELDIEEDEIIYPGGNYKLKIIIKDNPNSYLHTGASFDLFEGAKKIGFGSVMKILSNC